MNPVTLTSALPSHAQTPEGEIAFAKTEAWHKAMEKEQTELLRNAKSVVLGEQSRQNSQESETQNQARKTSQTYRQTTDSLHAQTSPRIVSNGSPGPLTLSQLQNFQHSTLPLQPVVTALEITHPYAAVESTLTPESSTLVSLLAAEYKQKWPLRNVHITVSEEGVSVWIRDAALSSDSKLAEGLVERIKNAIRQDGQELAGLIINGKTIY